MNKKTKKILFELSRNSRIPTNLLAKKLKSSPQSTSYLVNQLEKKKVINYETIADAVKLGYTNVLVGFNYTSFEHADIKKVMSSLEKDKQVISILEGTRGVDILAEYCHRNLSAFNKELEEFLTSFSKIIDTRFMQPVIVKHHFPRKYLVPNCDKTDLVHCGDRELEVLSENEDRILKGIAMNPKASLTALSRITGISTKAITTVKKNLEKRNIVRGYTCSIGLKKSGIRKEIIFLRLTGRGVNRMRQVVEYAQQSQNIIGLIKIIGYYHIMLNVESLNEIDVLSNIRSNLPIEAYLSVPIKSVIRERYIP
ncbi:MAG: Lrp/AsnC family transcriptional regulator [Nanoarchaeota archaeon]|nr:Lrp/AsnC family transcriptional regulator [Nanoarchaeota archaeon]